MPNYILKPHAFPAFQFGNRDFIYWEPCIQKAYSECRWRYKLDNEGHRCGFIVETDEGDTQIGSTGDYLVLENGTIRVEKKDAFESKYVRVEVGNNL